MPKGRPKSEERYGLPPLTFAEAAKVLDVREGELMNWVWEVVRPAGNRFGEWRDGRRDLPEEIIRLYIVKRRARDASYHEQFQALRDQKEREERLAAEAAERERHGAAMAAKKKAATRRRATG